MAEVWSDVPGYEGMYEVSDQGRVRGPEGILLPHHGKSGYVAVCLKREGEKARRRLVHRLVMQSFVGPDPSRPWVNHKNGVKCDNRLANLEWCTTEENNLHAQRMGLVLKGEDVATAKLKTPDIHMIFRLRSEGLKLREIAGRFGVHPSLIGYILRGEQWAHLGLRDPATPKRRNARLSEAQAREIFRLANEGHSVASLARQFRVSGGAVGDLLRGRNWRWLGLTWNRPRRQGDGAGLGTGQMMTL